MVLQGSDNVSGRGGALSTSWCGKISVWESSLINFRFSVLRQRREKESVTFRYAGGRGRELRKRTSAVNRRVLIQSDFSNKHVCII